MHQCAEKINYFPSEFIFIDRGDDLLHQSVQILCVQKTLKTLIVFLQRFTDRGTEAFVTYGDFQNIFDKSWLLFNCSPMSTLELLSMHVFSSCTSWKRRNFCQHHRCASSRNSLRGIQSTLSLIFCFTAFSTA